MGEPKVEYGWGEVNGQQVRTKITTYPPPTREDIARLVKAGVYTFGGGSVRIEFLDEPGADTPHVVGG